MGGHNWTQCDVGHIVSSCARLGTPPKQPSSQPFGHPPPPQQPHHAATATPRCHSHPTPCPGERKASNRRGSGWEGRPLCRPALIPTQPCGPAPASPQLLLRALERLLGLQDGPVGLMSHAGNGGRKWAAGGRRGAPSPPCSWRCSGEFQKGGGVMPSPPPCRTLPAEGSTAPPAGGTRR